MRPLVILGRLVVESAGPEWRLLGVARRDKVVRNRLTLARRPNELSPMIKANVGTLLPAVQITDRSGSAATIVNARITGVVFSPPRRGTPGGSTIHTHETEEVQITFQKIVVANLGGSSSTADDWNLPPP